MTEDATPSPTPHDEELLALVHRALLDVPPAAFEVTASWAPDFGRKELMVQPTRPAAAPISINYEVGHPEFNTTVGRTWLELDAPEGGDLLREIIEGVAINGFDEAGIMDYFGRVRLLNGRRLAFGHLHVPVPWKARPFRRSYLPYF